MQQGGKFFPLRTKAIFMKLPEQLKPALWGAVGGAVALAIGGFAWGGWLTEASANRAAQMRAETAVVTALAPICVEQFQQSSNSADQLAQLIAINSWDQRSYIEDRGWATMPGSDKPYSGVARACAVLLGNLKAS
jgi:hypothetical protein